MSLRTKFSFFVIFLTIITVSLFFYLLVGFSSISRVYKFQTDLQQTRFDFQNILTFSDRVRSRGVDIVLLDHEWVIILNTLDDDFKKLEKSKIRNKMNDEIKELAENCINSWNGMRSEMDVIYEHYKNISQMDLSFMLINTIRNSGITQGIENYRETENLSALEYEIAAIEREFVTIDIVYETFSTIFNNITQKISEYIEKNQRTFFTFAIITSVLFSFSVIFFTTVLMSSLMGRFKKIQIIADKLSERDLTFKAEEKSNDEAAVLVHTLNDTISILNDFFVVVKKTAEKARDFSSTINTSAMETASATHEINSNIESLGRQFVLLDVAVNKTVDSLQDMTKMLGILLEDNEKQTHLLKESTNAIEEIGFTISDVNKKAIEKVESAAEIQELVSDGDEKMDVAGKYLTDITSQLDEIGEVIDLINSIAEQTNILSMNAAIESAHAGEAGKGFSVVAEEIRILAESTSENAKRISGAIYGIINNVRNANETNVKASNAFRRVSEQAKGMMKSLNEITEGIKNVDSRSKLLTARTKDISASAIKISSICEKISTQQNVVSGEMDNMRSIFSESLSGMDEIKIGTEDITKRMGEVSRMSSESCDKMEELGASLDEFATQDNSYVLDI
ncbi:MAG: hypothetical protein GX220_00060 [Treponema sp.]|nr:hypothetical protein [Treponema sp.]